MLTLEESKKPFDELVESIRSDLCRLRWKLKDVEELFPQWKERIDFVEGGITCLLIALHSGVDEYRKFQIKKAEPATEGTERRSVT